MPILLFKLNGVPEDEADDIRHLLAENGIDVYETTAGRWGVSMAAIWLRDDDEGRLGQARTLIDDYQRERTARARNLWEERRRLGTRETLAGRLRHHPIRTLAYLVAVAAIVYLTLWPFLDWG